MVGARLLVVLLALTATSTPSGPGAEPNETLRDLVTPAHRKLYAGLLLEAWGGFSQYERAAFVVKTAQGALELRVWSSCQLRRTSFEGAPPADAVAIVHTHPPGDPRPSENDVRECKRIGLPFIVLSRRGVWGIDPKSGATTELDSSTRWFVLAVRDGRV